MNHIFVSAAQIERFLDTLSSSGEVGIRIVKTSSVFYAHVLDTDILVSAETLDQMWDQIRSALISQGMVKDAPETVE